MSMGNLNNFFILVICVAIGLFFVVAPLLINFILVSEVV